MFKITDVSQSLGFVFNVYLNFMGQISLDKILPIYVMEVEHT